METVLEGITAGGRYELRAHLATGGMATVFRAWDRRLEHPVAIKVLRQLDSVEEADVERFRREACAAAALHSPHIVEVYDFFEEEDCSYLVMELVDGVNLKQRIAAHGPLDPREACEIGIQVCRGLEVVHAAGFIHRDIKPQNVLLGWDGSIKLADFGIVYIPWEPSFTAAGIVLGTADYISPEQAQGFPLAPTTDIYSLGVVLYEALTGALPFTATTPAAVALRHAVEPVMPPRRRNPRIPRDVERVVLHALRKEPEARYLSAVAMEEVLQDVLVAHPAAAHVSIQPGGYALAVADDSEGMASDREEAYCEAPPETPGVHRTPLRAQKSRADAVSTSEPVSSWDERVGDLAAQILLHVRPSPAGFIPPPLTVSPGDTLRREPYAGSPPETGYGQGLWTATWRFAATLGVAALLIVGILLLHWML